jgi:uncharacterized lipoprotein NlpE involved in copper resistance
MKQLLAPLFTLVLILTLACCNRQAHSKDIISEEKMVSLLVETHLSDAILAKDPATVDHKRDMALYVYPSVMEKYGITRAQMDSSVAYYVRNPKIFVRIYDKVIKELERRSEETKVTETPEE